jgi:hypothetical protein
LKKSGLSLWSCIKALGIRNGFRYWQIGRACAKDPSCVAKWVEHCRYQARLCANRGELGVATCMRDWANRLESHQLLRDKLADESMQTVKEVV